ncbi:MAG: FtsX-like permease family protein [Candidatus Aminicenantes bacterium]|nr:FtsX-like permease family protein [Candidatus Aminicenantes bacterium]
MLKNYLKIILRNLKEQKGYSFINIASLTIGLSCCLLILLYIRYEFSYDKYHNDAQNIYRVVREYQGEPTWFNSSEHPLAASLKEDFPEVVKATRVKKNDEVGVVEYASKRFNEAGIYFVDQDFLEIFTFPLLSGDVHSALKEPFSVLITQEMADKYLGNEEPVGKILRIKEWYGEKKYDYTIRGVLKNIPQNSHFRFDFLVSYNTLYTLKRGGKESVETWVYYEPKTYIKLASPADPIELEAKFPAFLRKYKGEESASETIHLQRLTDIHLGGNLLFELETNSDMKYIYLFSAIAFFIIVIACLNYVNLSVARSAKRAVEVGMRKVVGAVKAQLVRQFMVESIAFSIFALMISFLLVDLVLSAFSSLIERNLTLSLTQDLDMVLVFLGIAIFIGILSGSYPAFFISSFHPIQIIKGTLRIGSKSSAVFRNSLVIVQFAVSIILIVCTFVIHNQLNYIRNRNLGFDKEQIITVYTMDRNLEGNPEPLKKELLKNPEILGVSASLDLPITVRRTSTVEWDEQGERRESGLYFTFVDYDYFKVYDMEIVKGRLFSEDFLTDKEQAVVINETAARNLGWEEPVGRRIYSQGREFTVIGMIKDFHFQSLHRRIDPLVFLFYEGRGIDYFSIKVSPSNIPSTIGFIEEKWRKFSPEFPFQYAFLDKRVDNIYKAEQKLGQSFKIFTFIALSIACMGLIGLASFVSEQKRKEIGIRKILGADIRSIITLLAREYVKCIAVAALIAWPIGYFAMSRWLQNFAYRISIGIEVFILSGLVAFVFALLTVSYQSIKAAIANPADSLRYE